MEAHERQVIGDRWSAETTCWTSPDCREKDREGGMAKRGQQKVIGMKLEVSRNGQMLKAGPLLASSPPSLHSSAGLRDLLP